jgi:hypothetical protein
MMPKIKRFKKLRLGSYIFDVKYDSHGGGCFSFGEKTLTLGINKLDFAGALRVLTHELMEMSIVEMNCRMQRPDVTTDFIFVMDHRQFETAACLCSGMLAQFLEG